MTAKLKPTLPDGTIRAQDAEADFHDWVAGRPLKRRMILVEVETNGIRGSSLERGRITGTDYVVLHAAEIRDPHEHDQLRHRITEIRANQGLEVSQPALFAASDAEQCSGLIELIAKYGHNEGLDTSDLDRKFHDALGGDEANLPDSYAACRSPQLLKLFAYYLGVISDNPVIDEDPDPDEIDGGTAEPDADTNDQPALAVVGSVPFKDVNE